MMHNQPSSMTKLNADPWLVEKFYGDDDTDYVFNELLPRFKQVLSHLKSNKVFDTPNNCKVLISITIMMQSVENHYSMLISYFEEETRRRLFSELIAKYTPLAEKLYAKHHALHQKLSTTLGLSVDSDDDDDDDDEV